jgi:hypothetical protein
METAAQLWCLPAHEKKEMDAEFAQAIATAIDAAVAEALERALTAARGAFNVTWRELGKENAQWGGAMQAAATETFLTIEQAIRALKEPR